MNTSDQLLYLLYDGTYVNFYLQVIFKPGLYSK